MAKQSTTPRLKAPLVGPSDFGKSPANVNAVVGRRKGTIDIHDSSTGEKVTVNEARLASLFNGGNTVTGVRGGRVHSTTDGGQKVSHGPGLNDGQSEQAMTLKHPSPAQRRADRQQDRNLRVDPSKPARVERVGATLPSKNAPLPEGRKVTAHELSTGQGEIRDAESGHIISTGHVSVRRARTVANAHNAKVEAKSNVVREQGSRMDSMNSPEHAARNQQAWAGESVSDLQRMIREGGQAADGARAELARRMSVSELETRIKLAEQNIVRARTRLSSAADKDSIRRFIKENQAIAASLKTERRKRK